MGASKRVYETNKGKICKVEGCNFTARVKGYCSHCYVKVQQDRMTYKKAGVDIEKEERAIIGILKSIKEQRKGIGKPLGGHYAGLIEFDEEIMLAATK